MFSSSNTRFLSSSIRLFPLVLILLFDSTGACSYSSRNSCDENSCVAVTLVAVLYDTSSINPKPLSLYSSRCSSTSSSSSSMLFFGSSRACSLVLSILVLLLILLSLLMICFAKGFSFPVGCSRDRTRYLYCSHSNTTPRISYLKRSRTLLCFLL